MVSEPWLQAFSGLAQSYGLSAAAFSTLFVFIVSVGFTLAIAVFVNKWHKLDFDFGIVLFYLFMAFFTFGGAMDWYVFGVMGLVGIIIYRSFKHGD